MNFRHLPFLPDLLLLLFLTVIVVNYDPTANLAPEYFLTVIQLGLLWLFCRTLFFLFPALLPYAAYAILLTGLIQAVWGLGQLYGYFPVRHVLFRTTGSFFNPGPYGGFLALMFPLALHFWLRFRGTRITRIDAESSQTTKGLRVKSAMTNLCKSVLSALSALKKYTFLAIGIVCMLVFPATLSRTAWIVAVIGCGLVLVFDTNIIAKLKTVYNRHRTIVLMGVIAFFIVSPCSRGFAIRAIKLRKYIK